jgi:hypothetical protein
VFSEFDPNFSQLQLPSGTTKIHSLSGSTGKVPSLSCQYLTDSTQSVSLGLGFSERNIINLSPRTCVFLVRGKGCVLEQHCSSKIMSWGFINFSLGRDTDVGLTCLSALQGRTVAVGQASVGRRSCAAVLAGRGGVPSLDRCCLVADWTRPASTRAACITGATSTAKCAISSRPGAM